MPFIIDELKLRRPVMDFSRRTEYQQSDLPWIEGMFWVGKAIGVVMLFVIAIGLSLYSLF